MANSSAPQPEILLDDYLSLIDDSCVAILPHVLRLAAELGIAEQLAEGERTAVEIAEAVGAHPGALARLLRALVSIGMLTEQKHTFRLTPAGNRMREGADNSVRASLLNTDSQLAWLQSLYTLRTGRPAYDRQHGAFFAHKDADDTANVLFLRRMRERASRLYSRFVTTGDWTGCRVVMDIGGGDGYLIEQVLEHVRGVRGALFDRPAVVDVVRAAGTFDRHACRLEAGDFFAGVPGGADTHLLCSVLHDWTDEQCVTILRNSRDALEPGGRLMIVEMLLPAEGSWHPSTWSDLGMMVLTGGRERTAKEFEVLLTKAGYIMSGVRAIPDSPFSVVNAKPDSRSTKLRLTDAIQQLNMKNPWSSSELFEDELHVILHAGLAEKSERTRRV
jgi:O-methyltransferase domain/Dimerisation domain